MISIRVSVALVTLLATAAYPARAQRWGGGGPGVSQPRVREGLHGRVVHGVPAIIVVPFVRVEDRDDFRRRSGGGSWDGSRPAWGESPPVPVAPNYAAFFGYVPPRGQVVTQNAPDVEPMRTRDAYRMRRRTP
ncbi:MAG TPA: hypothetical protein VHE78_14965 [Gemmatimonadaceae bacterium]|nr:hypothetical protein [Gemmatimonadaceae bacterium]